MKKVSGKVFFTVMWRGICQAVRWFFGLFGKQGWTSLKNNLDFEES